MKRLQAIGNNFSRNMTVRKCIAVILGNIILGIGCAGLKLSLMGNEPYSAVNMALSDGFGMGLGNYQLIVNLIMLIIQIIWGYMYIGFGSVINLCFLGYIIQGAEYLLLHTIGDCSSAGLVYSVIYMAASMIVLTFGLGMYQEANLGVAPYDYLSMGISDATKWPFFLCRVLTDSVCVLIIVGAAGIHFIGWEKSHLGIGTVIGAFCLGPFVSFFRKLHHRWIFPTKTEQKT